MWVECERDGDNHWYFIVFLYAREGTVPILELRIKTEMSNAETRFTQIGSHRGSASNNARYFSANSPHTLANNGTIKENQEGDRDV